MQDKTQRNITFNKRHQCLIKKAIELSMLCGQEVYISIFDRNKGKLVEYSSSEDLTLNKVTEVHKKHSNLSDEQYVHYIDDDYHLL